MDNLQSEDFLIQYTDPHYCTDLFKKLLDFRKDDGLYCDMVFLVGDIEYPVHRAIFVASCSDFVPSLKDSSPAYCLPRAAVHETNYKSFEALLEYVYSGTISLHDSVALDVLKLSLKFGMPQLTSFCCQYFERTMTSGNCLQIRDLGAKYQLDLLIIEASRYIANHIEDVIELNSVLSFGEDKLGEFLSKLDSVGDNLKLNLITSWIHFGAAEKRHEALLDLMKRYLATMTIEEVLITMDKTFGECANCLELLNDEKRFRERTLFEGNSITRESLTDQSECWKSCSDVAVSNIMDIAETLDLGNNSDFGKSVLCEVDVVNDEFLPNVLTENTTEFFIEIPSLFADMEENDAALVQMKSSTRVIRRHRRKPKRLTIEEMSQTRKSDRKKQFGLGPDFKKDKVKIYSKQTESEQESINNGQYDFDENEELASSPKVNRSIKKKKVPTATLR